MLRIGTGGSGLALGCEEFSSFHAYGFALWKSQRCSAEKRLFKYLRFGKSTVEYRKMLEPERYDCSNPVLSKHFL